MDTGEDVFMTARRTTGSLHYGLSDEVHQWDDGNDNGHKQGQVHVNERYLPRHITLKLGALQGREIDNLGKLASEFRKDIHLLLESSGGREKGENCNVVETTTNSTPRRNNDCWPTSEFLRYTGEKRTKEGLIETGPDIQMLYQKYDTADTMTNPTPRWNNGRWPTNDFLRHEGKKRKEKSIKTGSDIQMLYEKYGGYDDGDYDEVRRTVGGSPIIWDIVNDETTATTSLRSQSISSSLSSGQRLDGHGGCEGRPSPLVKELSLHSLMSTTTSDSKMHEDLKLYEVFDWSHSSSSRYQRRSSELAIGRQEEPLSCNPSHRERGIKQRIN